MQTIKPKQAGTYDNKRDLVRERWIELNGDITLDYKVNKITIDAGADFKMTPAGPERIDHPIRWSRFPDYDNEGNVVN